MVIIKEFCMIDALFMFWKVEFITFGLSALFVIRSESKGNSEVH